MTEFRKGDKVRVAFEAEVTNVREDGQRLWVYHAGVADTYLNVSDVELIERADDPSRDPAGTVRRSKDGKIAVRVREGGEQSWFQLEIGENAWGWLFDDWVTGWPVIGVMPGTPAWDAWQKGELRGAPEFPGKAESELWVGDGSEEPPAHVKAVKDKSSNYLNYLVRAPKSGWFWHSKPAWDDEYDAEGVRWVDVAYLADGSLTEVRDD